MNFQVALLFKDVTVDTKKVKIINECKTLINVHEVCQILIKCLLQFFFVDCKSIVIIIEEVKR
jgi:hypothetical protein